MDDNVKNTFSYQQDQELLDARGINMTVEEVAGLSTCKYSQRVQGLKVSHEDLVFLKSLRRRIKNRLASQNSRRRSVEHLRRLTRELRAVRACRRDALAERRALVQRRDAVRGKCATLRKLLLQVLKDRSDTTEVPSIEVDIPESHISKTATDKQERNISVIVKNNVDRKELEKELEQEEDIYERVRRELAKEREPIIINTNIEKETIIIKEEVPDYEEMTIEDDFETERRKFEDTYSTEEYEDNYSTSFDDNYSTQLEDYSTEENYSNMVRKEINRDRDIFECQIGKLVQQSVNHIFSNEKKKVYAKTVFIGSGKLSSNIKSMVLEEESGGVLNLCVKEGRRKSHGRKQSAPRRIACSSDSNDAVLDLKIKKEPQ